MRAHIKRRILTWMILRCLPSVKKPWPQDNAELRIFGSWIYCFRVKSVVKIMSLACLSLLFSLYCQFTFQKLIYTHALPCFNLDLDFLSSDGVVGYLDPLLSAWDGVFHNHSCNRFDWAFSIDQALYDDFRNIYVGCLRKCSHKKRH